MVVDLTIGLAYGLMARTVRITVFVYLTSNGDWKIKNRELIRYVRTSIMPRSQYLFICRTSNAFNFTAARESSRTRTVFNVIEHLAIGVQTTGALSFARIITLAL